MTASEPAIWVEIDDVGAAYIHLTDGDITHTRAVTEDVNIDIDHHGNVVGIELLDLDQKIPFDDLTQQYNIPPDAIQAVKNHLTRLRVLG